MSQVIRYDVPLNSGEFELEIPGDHNCLTFGAQNDQPYVWILVNPRSPIQKKKFRVFQPGEEGIDKISMHYVGTAIMAAGNMTRHLFEV